MLHILWKPATLSLVTMLIAFSIGHNANVTFPSDFSLPEGNYVNVDAAFGSAELTLMDNGRYTYGDDGSVSAEGTYTITGNQITFIEYGPADASCLHLRGIYVWALKSRTMTLTEVEDQCSAREDDWKSGEWLRTRQ